MFTKPVADITFPDVKEFCREFGEGERVEYKREISVKKHIPKIVSSFANTYGGIFVIGVEADKEKNKVVAIDGIPNSGGIEEQIRQSALTGIYPAVMPEVRICDVPNTNNVVVIVRVNESLQAPHAIQNSTRVYIRTGSITQPYKLSEIDRIEHMLKHREDSQRITQQILNRTEKRANRAIDRAIRILGSPLTVIVRPVFPYRPLISTGDIFNFATENGLVGNYSSRVAGGVAGGIAPPTMLASDSSYYWELNEYGIVYEKIVLRRIDSRTRDHNGRFLVGLHFLDLVQQIRKLINRAQSFYKKSEYFGHVEVTAQLKRVEGLTLIYSEHQYLEEIGSRRSIDSEISASTQFLPRDLEKKEKFIETVNELAGQLLWAFNIDNPTQSRGLIERIL